MRVRGAMRADCGRHDFLRTQDLPYLFRIAEHDATVFTVAGRVQEIIRDHHGSGATLGGVLADAFKILEIADQLPGLDAGNDADLPGATEVQPCPIWIEIAVYFLIKEWIHG